MQSLCFLPRRRPVYALDDQGATLGAPPPPRKRLRLAEAADGDSASPAHALPRLAAGGGQAVVDSLVRAQYELSQLYSLFNSHSQLTALERVDRVSNEDQETSIGLAVTKKNKHLAAVHSLLTRSLEDAERELKLQRVFRRELVELAQRWRLVVPLHGPTSANIKSHEMLAFDCGSRQQLLPVIRDDANGGRVAVAPVPGQWLVARIDALSGAKVLGQAVLEFPSQTKSEDASSLASSTLQSPVEQVLESARQAFLAKNLFKSLPSSEPVFPLDEECSLVFELAVSRPPSTGHHPVCRAALLALQTGQDVVGAARHTLQWPKLCEALKRVVPSGKLQWKHDSPLLSRCVVQLADSQAWTLEIVLRAGRIELGACSKGVFPSRDAPALTTVADVVHAVKTARAAAYVWELCRVAEALKPSTRSNFVVDVCLLPRPTLVVEDWPRRPEHPLRIEAVWAAAQNGDEELCLLRSRGAGTGEGIAQVPMRQPFALELRRLLAGQD